MNSNLSEKFKEVEQCIKKSEYILLAGHKNPDGDSIGSLLGLYFALKENLGLLSTSFGNITKEIIPYCDDDIPQSLQFLNSSSILTNKIGWYPDLVICLDYGDFKRLGLPEEKIQGAQIVTFDHHPQFAQRGDVKIIDTTFSSTSELVYEFLKAIHWKVSAKSATYLLTGIMTDTGEFATGPFVHNISARTLKNIGELLQIGASINTIKFNVFMNKSFKVLNAWGDLIKKIIINTELGYAGIILSFDEFIKYGIVIGELEIGSVISILNVINDTKFSFFAVEYDRGKIKGSLRSTEFKDIDVSRIAELLGGGGHMYASGFELECSFDEAKKRIVEAIQEVFEKEKIQS